MSLKSTEKLDFDDEARKLWTRLNIESPGGSKLYSPLDPIWRHPVGGGTIYVGNQVAAQSFDMLRENRITHVVNCTSGSSAIPNYHEGRLNYYVFPVIFILLCFYSANNMFTDNVLESICRRI